MPKNKLAPQDAQRAAQQSHGYGSILLSREGDWAVVKVRVGDLYVPVIRELYDGQFYHFVEPLGIEDEVVRFFSERISLFRFESLDHWVRTATRQFLQSGHTSRDTVCIDAKSRLINGGDGFQRADEDGAYPVRVYSTKAEELPQYQGRKGSRERNRRVAFPARPRPQSTKRKRP